jgi:hypothetical protein
MSTTDVPDDPEPYVDGNPSSRYYNNATTWGPLGLSDGSVMRGESDPVAMPIIICVGAIILFCLCLMPILERCCTNNHPNGFSQGQEDQPQEEERCSKEEKEARAKIIEAYILQESIVSLDDHFVSIVLLRSLLCPSR